MLAMFNPSTVRHLTRLAKTLSISRLGPNHRLNIQATSFYNPAINSVRNFSRECQEPEEDMDNLKTNPYFAKYANKLEDKQQSDPDQFQTTVDKLEAGKKKEADDKKEQLEEMLAEKKAQQSKPKTLDSIVKLELFKDKNPDEIEIIWKEYHSTKDCVFAPIPRAEYEEIYSRAQEFPTFVYPVPRADGYEFFLQQWNGHEIHFTSMTMYQAHKENAPASLILHHYPELMKDKGIVLMHGYPDARHIAVHESQLLAMQVKLYYGMHSGLKFNLVRMFNNSPDSFRHMDLVKEFENYKKDTVASKTREF